MAPVSSCVSEVAIPRVFIAKFSQPETCLRTLDARGAHKYYLATPANHHKEHGRLAHA
jgi:hypothetical protein